MEITVVTLVEEQMSPWKDLYRGRKTWWPSFTSWRPRILRVGCKLNGVEAKVDDYEEVGDSMTRWKDVAWFRLSREGDEDGKDLESKIDDVMVTRSLQGGDGAACNALVKLSRSFWLKPRIFPRTQSNNARGKIVLQKHVGVHPIILWSIFEHVAYFDGFVNVFMRIDLRSYALSWKPCQGDSSKLNLPYHKSVLTETEGAYGCILDMGDDVDISTLTVEQYLALTQDNIRPGMVKHEIGKDVKFEINSNFMSELRRKLFARTDNEDAHEHVQRVLEIVDLFHFPGVTHDAVMLRKLEQIRNFKQEIDETLYHAWERYSDRCPQHDLNCQQKVHIFYTGLDISTRRMLDSRGFITLMTPTQALISIQVMADHSHSWYEETTIKEKMKDNADNVDAIQVSRRHILPRNTIHITPPDDDYVTPATNPILDKQLNEFKKKFSDITRVAKKANCNPVNDVKELSDIKKYDHETFIQKLLHQVSQSSHKIGENELAQDGDFLDFSTGILHLICLKAKLKGVSCSNSTLPIYFISLMYNMDIVQNKWGNESRIIT
ncbi:hypothetical protein Tco_1066738 [Tanacetum coccineum]|uniref:Uncharacterized protein n=1 Tax=Tanacetum coccineum TaxID=301880 RepID=A0ABQ5HAW7_9ASTR